MNNTTPRSGSSRGTAGAAGKTLEVLRAFADGQEAWGVRELAAALDLPTSSVHRSLKILQDHGLLGRDDVSGRYRLGNEWHRWSMLSRRHFRLPGLVRPVARSLAGELGAPVWLAVFDPSGPYVWAAFEESPGAGESTVQIGLEEPLTAGAAGLAVLAASPSSDRTEATDADLTMRYQAQFAQLAKHGFIAYPDDDDELSVSLAAPILNALQQPLGSLVVTLPAHQLTQTREAEAGALLSAAARRISISFATRFLIGSDAASSQPGMQTLANILRQKNDRLELTPWRSGGSDKLREINDGRAAYATAVGSVLNDVRRGVAPFPRPLERLRTVTALVPLQLHILVAADLPPMSFADLARLRVSPGERDYATAGLYLRLMAEAGLNETSFEKLGGGCFFLDYRESNRLFEQGRLDALVSLNAPPHPRYHKLARKRPFRLLALEDDLVAAIVKKGSGLARSVIAPGHYPRQTEPVQTVESPLLIVTAEDRDEDEVYDFVRAASKHAPELAAMKPAFEVRSPDAACPGCLVETHPGAARFFAEGDRRRDRS
ncbi:TAXI family TRAP transporter solute-binding subunit [Limimaricola litoreus]|uniref:TAXI family TRAP transporter solute-binding subunit n=1 Tax=Limimaricola litoreus TaxID=2955316 RepID=A0A9X2JR56_9RHOB|nr:TAXI family TRAP transporter solute-binding subunit [Limimaricola litoreus]MCP1170624.1 TAXI family TRAP transporter solute-binding subunit [Limimaricola litoreus]